MHHQRLHQHRQRHRRRAEQHRAPGGLYGTAHRVVHVVAVGTFLTLPLVTGAKRVTVYTAESPANRIAIVGQVSTLPAREGVPVALMNVAFVGSVSVNTTLAAAPAARFLTITLSTNV